MFCEINLGCKFPIILVLTLDLMDSSIIMVHFFYSIFFSPTNSVVTTVLPLVLENMCMSFAWDPEES